MDVIFKKKGFIQFSARNEILRPPEYYVLGGIKCFLQDYVNIFSQTLYMVQYTLTHKTKVILGMYPHSLNSKT